MKPVLGGKSPEMFLFCLTFSIGEFEDLQEPLQLFELSLGVRFGIKHDLRMTVNVRNCT